MGLFEENQLCINTQHWLSDAQLSCFGNLFCASHCTVLQ